MSRLKNIRIALLPSPSNITSAPETSWTPLGLGKDVLLRELEALYWEGVRGELENILRTLNTWHKPDFSSVRVDDEDDDFIHGFDTFIDQVTEESRAFAIRYGILKQEMAKMRQKNSTSVTPTKKYAEVLEQVLRDRQTDHASSRLKAGVRRAIDGKARDVCTFTGLGLLSVCFTKMDQLFQDYAAFNNGHGCCCKPQDSST
jgi:hypothetical protein